MALDSPHAAVSRRIEQLFPRLSPQLRQAARYVLDRPDDVALQSMRSVAASAGVQPATMVRLAKALDYPGFDAFREPFRERLRHPVTGYASRARALQARSRSVPDAPHGELLSEMLTADVGNLRETYERIGFDTLARCGDALGDAERGTVVAAAPASAASDDKQGRSQQGGDARQLEPPPKPYLRM